MGYIPDVFSITAWETEAWSYHQGWTSCCAEAFFVDAGARLHHQEPEQQEAVLHTWQSKQKTESQHPLWESSCPASSHCPLRCLLGSLLKWRKRKGIPIHEVIFYRHLLVKQVHEYRIEYLSPFFKPADEDKFQIYNQIIIILQLEAFLENQWCTYSVYPWKELRVTGEYLKCYRKNKKLDLVCMDSEG